MKQYTSVFILLMIVYNTSIIAGFLAGTPVKVTQGTIPIEQLVVGNTAACFDTINNISSEQAITRITKRAVSRYKHITIGATTIDVSFGHLFYLPLERKWIAAQSLIPGNTLLTSNNTDVVIDTIQDIVQSAPIYDLSIFEYHDYYVSDLEILVYNS